MAINTKNYILDKYYNEHKKPTIIAKELNVDPSYITKIIKKMQDMSKKKNIELKLVKKTVKLQKENGLEIKGKMKMINNYLNLLNNNILKQVKNYLILLK